MSTSWLPKNPIKFELLIEKLKDILVETDYKNIGQVQGYKFKIDNNWIYVLKTEINNCQFEQFGVNQISYDDNPCIKYIEKEFNTEMISYIDRPYNELYHREFP